MTPQYVPISQAHGLALDSIDIFCPIPLKMHPMGAAALDANMIAWVQSHGLIEPGTDLTRNNVGLIQAAGTPLWREDAIKAFGNFFMWGICWDGHLDALSSRPWELIAHSGECLRALLETDAAPSADNKWVTAYRDARNQMHRAVAPLHTVDFERSAAHMHAGWAWKYALPKLSHRPTVGECIRMRLIKGGIDTLASFTPPASGYVVKPEYFYSPVMRAFILSVFFPCLIINEVISLAKEMYADQPSPNIVTALSEELDISLPEALEKTWEIYERTVCLMLRLQERLLDHPNPEVARYAAEIPYWIPATAHWTLTSPRYLEDPAFIARTGGKITIPQFTLTDTPTRCDPDDLTPPPFPDVAWWWHQLAT